MMVLCSETANSVSMFYNISSTNNLIIGAAASDNVNNRPTHPVGHIAYNNRYDPNNAVQFGTAAFVRENRGSFSRVKCHIEDSSDGDGTCDLVCTGKGKGHVVTVGFSVETKNDDQWHLGTGGNRAIHVKAVF